MTTQGVTTEALSGMCAIYAASGTLSFCYDMNEASGTTLSDSSSAGHTGTISSSGVTYHVAGLTTNSADAETTNGSTGSMTAGFSPTTGSFSISFFVSLKSNGNNFGHLAATGSPGNTSPSEGWNIDINEDSENQVFAKLGYGTGQLTISGAGLPLNTPSNVTLTYNASSRVGTLCVGNSSSPSCVTGTLPAAYVSSGKPVVFGGGTAYYPVDATFDEAAFFQGTVLTGSEIDAIAANATGAKATPSPVPTATPKATAKPTPTPTSTAKATPTPAPTPTTKSTPNPGASAYDPPAGTAPYFPLTPFDNKIPNPPTVNPSSAAWVSSMDQGGNFSLNTINVASYEPDKNDHNYTIYYNHSGSNTPVKIHCLDSFGTGIYCNDEGMTVYIDPREKIQNDDVSGGDDHLVLVDPAAGYEYDFWVVAPPFPPTNGTLTVNYSGRCLLSGDGFTNPSYSGPSWNAGCKGTEDSNPVTMGIIRPEDVMAALNSSTGTLPQALSFGITCPGIAPGGALPPPFLGSGNGTCPSSTHPYEGNRLYLAMHDSDVNALSGVSKIVKVILRTLDEDHYGGYLTNAGGTQAGIQMYGISDNSYLSWGAPDPWTTEFLPEAKAEGLPGSTTPTANGMYQIQLPLPSSVSSKVRFL